MAHEIEQLDRLVLRKERAWHGMGLVLDQDLTPVEAAAKAFPYTVIQRPLTYRVNEKNYVLEDLVTNLRSDRPDVVLGVVSPSYRIIQPLQLAEFAEALSVHGKVVIETAGSIRNGKRMWFLCRGGSFEVGNGDTVYEYLLLSNGFDRATACRITPTTIRTVCSNTLHAVIPRNDTGALEDSAYVIRHTENAMDRVEEVKAALRDYGRSQGEMREVIRRLAATPLTQVQVQEFFLESYTADFGEIPANPQNKAEQNRRDRALSAAASFSKRFDDERMLAGASAWNALNAYTGLVQHDRKSRGQDDTDRVELRVEQNLFGLNQDRSLSALRRAFRLTAV